MSVRPLSLFIFSARSRLKPANADAQQTEKCSSPKRDAATYFFFLLLFDLRGVSEFTCIWMRNHPGSWTMTDAAMAAVRPEQCQRPVRPELGQRPELCQRPELYQRPELGQRPVRPELGQRPVRPDLYQCPNQTPASKRTIFAHSVHGTKLCNSLSLR